MKVLVRYGLDEGADIGLLADSSLLLGNRPLFVPDWAHSFQCTLGLAVRVCRLGKCVAPRFAHRYWDAVTGCLITRGLDGQGKLIDVDALNVGHDGALLLGQMVDKEALSWPRAVLACHSGSESCGAMPLCDLPALIDATLAHVSCYMTLKMGDLLCLCGDVHATAAVGDAFSVQLDGQLLMRVNVK